MEARPTLRLHDLDDRLVPATLAAAGQLTSVSASDLAPALAELKPADVSLRSFLGSSNQSLLVQDDVGTNTASLAGNLIAVGSPAGRPPLVRIYDRESGYEAARIMAYSESFTGGVRVAAGDVTGDGITDLVTAAGAGGGAHIRILDGVTFTPVADFFAYDASFRGGATVAVADVTGDKTAEIITGAGPGGGPHVKIFDGKTQQEIRGTFAFDPSFTGGVNVAAADVTGDGQADLIVGAASGNIGPRVKVLNATTFAAQTEILATDAANTGGATVAAGAVLGDGTTSVIVGTADAGGPMIRTYSGISGTQQTEVRAFTSTTQRNVKLSVGDYNGDGQADIAATAGSGDITTIRAFTKGITEIARFNVPNVVVEL